MDMCLLCLELRHETVECIYVASEIWHVENIEQVIEQHFWPIETIHSHSWICSACWFVLKEFHNFYIRIEEAHVDLTLTMNAMNSPLHLQPEMIPNEEAANKNLAKSIKGLDIFINLEDLNNVLTTQQHSESENQYITLPDNLMTLRPLNGSPSGVGQTEEHLHGGIQSTKENRKNENVGIQQANTLLDKNILPSREVEDSNCPEINEIHKVTAENLSEIVQTHSCEPNRDMELPLCKNVIEHSTVDSMSSGANDEEPIIDGEKPRKRLKDPLKRPLFTKIRKIPRITIAAKQTLENVEESKHKRFNILNTNNKEVERKATDFTNDLALNSPNDKVRSNNENKPIMEQSVTTKHCKDTSTEGNQSHETPLPKSSEPNKLDTPKVSVCYNTRSKTKNNETKTEFPKDLEMPVDDTLQYRADSNSDNPSDPEILSALDKCKVRLSTHEYDDFLAKNFKIICDLCHEEVKTFSELRKHFKAMHKKQAYVLCCNKKFMRRSPLVEHIRWHCQPSEFTCKYCDKVMSNRRTLDLHQRHVHEKKFAKHTCDICGRSFASSNVLKNHKMIHLSEEERKYRCDNCGKKYGSETLLHNHVRAVHLAKYIKVCDICGRKIRSRDVFERHMLTHKGLTLSTYSCDICGYRVTGKSALRRHKMSKHPLGGVVEYKCHLCPKIMNSLMTLRRHVRYKHETGRNFKCTMCRKDFKRRSSLREHMATHTKDPLYKCPYCPLKFNSNANMHKHRKKDHPLEWLEDRRAKYSGKVPPDHIHPCTLPLELQPTIDDNEQLPT
ncbi:transcription factor grauzone [Stomoxys calcitrans]|uniref:transcription factor grauzone n=1 Tax=Stomoxys calcitrans TaxID=35570 RepID=UPI0027E31D27|nr:transcription factor grauzone [Stomoxys calcitrans]